MHPPGFSGAKSFDCGDARCIAGSNMATGPLTASVAYHGECDMMVYVYTSTTYCIMLRLAFPSQNMPVMKDVEIAIARMVRGSRINCTM